MVYVMMSFALLLDRNVNNIVTWIIFYKFCFYMPPISKQAADISQLFLWAYTCIFVDLLASLWELKNYLRI